MKPLLPSLPLKTLYLASLLTALALSVGVLRELLRMDGRELDQPEVMP